MTEITGEACMFARAGNHLLVGIGMAGDANLLMLAFKADIQRLVRVVATKTVFNLIMGAAFMAVAAAGYVVCHAWTMPFMAGLAIDFGFVRGAICLDLRRLFTVAFDTIGNRQRCLLRQRSGTRTKDKHRHKRCYRQNVPLILKHNRSS
jgi:hypothetical protein